MHREELMKKAGKMVTVYYHTTSKEQCFAIGWFYAMDVDTIKLKVTSTRFETYESIELELLLVDKIEDYLID